MNNSIGIVRFQMEEESNKTGRDYLNENIDRLKEISFLTRITKLWGLNVDSEKKTSIYGIFIMIIVYILVILSFLHAMHFAFLKYDTVYKATLFVKVLGQILLILNYHHFNRNKIEIRNILAKLPDTYGRNVNYKSNKKPILIRVIIVTFYGILLYLISLWFIFDSDRRLIFDRFNFNEYFYFNNKYSIVFAAIFDFCMIVFIEIPFVLFFLFYSTICRILRNDMRAYKKLFVMSHSEIKNLFELYNKLCNIFNEFDAIYSNTVFWWMSIIILQGIFYGSVGIRMFIVNNDYSWGLYFSALIFFLIVNFVDMSYAAASIPLEASDITACLSQKMVSECPLTSRYATAMYLKNTWQPPQLTVGKTVSFNLSFIYSVFSTIITYFVIVVQL
ncbi:uncharacterized protein LOC111636090 [Centruroides sculpturatus]|uniref:uncharacterized protein LOC111636090 n=1 Tax=Centruroides sculpturatus TaxID=218467 RepID=UPI000C6CB00E|nr:uncharacterized protein LOC111636090 [Centruroides sculpturatus]XP_023237042.1 uncharacterized protein LOC111636090 [Centruroides sculpturatus]